MEVSIADKGLDVNVTVKKLIKDVLAGARKAGSNDGLGKHIRGGVNSIKAAQKARPSGQHP